MTKEPVKKSNIDMMDIEELACKIIGIDIDDPDVDGDTQIIEENLFADLGIDLEQFKVIVDRLMPLIDIGDSPLTNKRYKGFSNQNGLFIAKIEIINP